ncbi:NAD(P)-binding protein [Didymella exigua CBS 183.55]|uniref:NAD(P)-binding protein n=1 Tax=Didymella exigua CBS 183.55 TaxID=1150837 RepID=A0A6A5RXG6_9PLEO|nr:NAD(P)-binding protein [Didymella exigua CBS 183.55]KAF1931914.1 NAD(P)-binding protein [Didymella exigua CBS 183.55]
MADHQVIVVVGSNRGVGRGIVQLLANQQLHRPLTIYATSRSGIDSSINILSPSRVLYRELDIANPSSIHLFFESALEEHGAIDVLINNAAVSNDHQKTPDLAAEMVWTNYGGTRDMCKAFLAQPTIRPGARIINMTSGYNRLQDYSPELQELFRDADDSNALDELAAAY